MCTNIFKAAWRHANREKVREYQRRYELENAEKVAAAKKAYIDANREAHYQRVRKWHEANPDKRNAATARRYVRRKQAVPPWADLNAIDEFYKMARWVSEVTGVAHEVDHVIPLRGKKVSGLHCEANLRVIPAFRNRAKNAIFKIDWD